MIDRASGGAPHGRRASSSCGRARRALGERQLERALDGRLAGLVRAADDGQPRRQIDVERAIATEVAADQLADPHSETSWPASSSRPSRRASRCSAASAVEPAASSSAMRASRSRMNAPAIVSGRRQRALGQRRHRRVAHPDLEEGGREGDLDLIEVEVELVPADADQPDVEDEVRIGLGRQQVDQGRLAGDRGGIDLELGEPGPSDLSLVDRRGPLAGLLVELDQQDLARPVLVEGDRLGRAGVGVRDGPGLAALGGVPVTEGEVVEPGRGDLLGRDHDLVTVGLARDRRSSRGPSRRAT